MVCCRCCEARAATDNLQGKGGKIWRQNAKGNRGELLNNKQEIVDSSNFDFIILQF